MPASSLTAPEPAAALDYDGLRGRSSDQLFEALLDRDSEWLGRHGAAVTSWSELMDAVAATNRCTAEARAAFERARR